MEILYSMKKREMDQEKILNLLHKKAITQKEASEILCLSVRQIRRKLKNFIKDGVCSLMHKNRGKQSNRKIDIEIELKTISIINQNYKGYGPTLASEKLEQHHNIKVDHETLRKWMIKHNIYIPKKIKLTKRSWREPKHHKGELVQLDGSYHMWIKNIYCTLIAFIDDASREVFARFEKESTEGVSKTFELYIKKYGRPIKIYTDRGKVFKINNGSTNNITQFVRMLGELNIKISYAYSPQAKGRIERLFKTLQDRLAKEIARLNITTVEQANLMLDQFLHEFNNRFSQKPVSDESLFMSLDGYDLNSILCNKYKRIINNDYTIAYKNKWYQITKTQAIILRVREAIDVHEAFDKTITLWKNGVKLNFKEIKKGERQAIKDTHKVFKDPVLRKKNLNHPWRKWEENITKKYTKPDISK